MPETIIGKCASRRRISDWSLDSGTAGLLDPLGQTPGVQIALDAQAPGDGQSILTRRIWRGAAAPQCGRPVFLEGAAVEAYKIIRLGCLFCFHDSYFTRAVIMSTKN
ncbi:MAG: hypothetical protein ABSG91_06450 [Syntrophobacteraceae bacterium]